MDARHRRRHVEERSLVEGGHELRPEPAVDRDREEHEDAGAPDHEPRPAERPCGHRLVQADEKAADRVPLLGVDLSDESDVRDPAQPARAEVVLLHAREEEPERRVQRDREDGGDEHAEGLRVGQRLEEAPLLGLQREDGEEGDRDHQQREEARASDLLHRADDDAPVVLLAVSLLPDLELLVRLLDHDDRRVHERAHRDRDPSQRHDVRRDSHHPERDEGDEDRDRDRDDRDEGARDVPEEEEDHEGDDDADLDQGRLKAVDRAGDQLGAVVDRDHLRSGRQAGLDLLQLCLHAPDHVEGVLALPHDHDPRDRFALPVEVGDSPPDVGTQDHLSHVLDEDRRAGVARHQYDVLEVGDRAGVAAAPDHVLGAAEVDEAPSHFAVAGAHGLDHATDRQPVGLQPVRVDVDLELADVSAERGDVGDARDGFQVVAEVPVLGGAHVGEAALARLVHESVLVDPAQARRIRTQLGLHARREAREDRREVLQRPGAGPVDVGAVLEDDVDVRVAEVGDAADGLDLRRAEHGPHDRVRDLVLDDVGAPVPAGVDDHLRVAEVRDRVQREAVHRPPAEDGRGGRQGKDEESVPGGEIDDAVDHGRLSPLAIAGAGLIRLSESRKNVPATTIRSPAASPSTISTFSPKRQPVLTSRAS